MKTIGFYPVVDSVDWVRKLAPLNIQTLQLRIKTKTSANVEDDVKESIALARQYNCNLYINDYWELAIKHGAHGIHLGQEDIQTADIQAIHKAGICLGVSTHNDREVDAALACDPHYIAYGPIYNTTTKIMKATPRGTDRLTYWVNALNLPVVAIGGINLERVDAVVKTGVDGVAVVSAVTKAVNYKQAVSQFKHHTAKYNQTELA
ncbi:MAG: thiamine phosphate synthase [Coxiella sp. (in: Bacteria)]|nr:MAG: thiamine phosphate synthase [Coxiella sp. (in: g-proteobacteria)]